MRFFKSQNYFWQVLTTIGIVSIALLLVILSTLAYFMVLPLGKRATDDLASVIVHGAETWHALPSSKRAKFIERMKLKHELLMTNPDSSLAERSNLLPYLFFLEKSLHKQLGQAIPIKQSQAADGEEWFWADIPVSDSILRFGFPRSRIGVQPPIAFFLLITIGIYLIVITTITLTKRLTAPIERLHHAAQSIGKGHWPKPVHIDSPKELAVLAREFNHMGTQMRELLSNRTTLIAGIAHDLRTPLTQIQLALAMLPNDGGDPKLMRSIQEDLDVINHLISEALSISFEFEGGNKETADIGEELRKVITGIQTDSIDIKITQDKDCHLSLDRLALRRTLSNLLVNAVRYGDNKSITVNYDCNDDEITVQIMDRGPGIPPEHLEAVFRPFYRLEKSRSSKTGGSGLGLAIVKQLADANNWSVKLLPRPGGGTIAMLVIPCTQE